ncbi:SETMR methyltransferase, partial [Acromyrmex heyeri]
MKDLTPKEIKAKLDNVHSTFPFTTVYNWVNGFKRDRTSTCDAPRSGRPIETATPEIIDTVHDIVLTDRRVKVCELVEATGMSNPDEFLRRFITVDETWIHYFTSETKKQSKQWTSPTEPAPKKAKIVKLIGKVATVFWDARALLDCFNNILKKNCPHLVKKKVLFHQDNAWVHMCPAPMAKFNKFRYELLAHSAYSSDLVLCDYYLFPNLKKWFGGKRFTTREQLIAETKAYFEGLGKCIEPKENYVEK